LEKKYIPVDIGAHTQTGWEPIFEHEGETLAEMAHDKKVKAFGIKFLRPIRPLISNRTNYPIAIKPCANSRNGWPRAKIDLCTSTRGVVGWNTPRGPCTETSTI
jgi:hypothetical protein